MSEQLQAVPLHLVWHGGQETQWLGPGWLRLCQILRPLVTDLQCRHEELAEQSDGKGSAILCLASSIVPPSLRNT